MASPPASPEASEVRRRGQRRLIGAVAIVLLLVVFVPMVLDSEPRPERKGPDLQIPPRETAPPLPPPVPPSPKMADAMPKPGRGEAAPAPAPSQAAAPTPAPAPAPAPEKVAREAARAAVEAQVAVVEPQAIAKKAEVLKPQAPPRLEGFALQVGAFRDDDKLRQAREKLAAANVVHYTERIEAAGGPMTRLRAGPFPTRAAAEAAAEKLKAAAPEAKVVPLP